MRFIFSPLVREAFNFDLHRFSVVRVRCLALIGAFWGSAYVASLDLIGKVFSYFSGLPSNGISRGVNNVAWLYEPRTRVCTLAGGVVSRCCVHILWFRHLNLERRPHAVPRTATSWPKLPNTVYIWCVRIGMLKLTFQIDWVHNYRICQSQAHFVNDVRSKATRIFKADLHAMYRADGLVLRE